MISKLPKLLKKKETMKDCYEVPAEILPEFCNYSVQFLCWGVRDLLRYKVFKTYFNFLLFIFFSYFVYNHLMWNLQ